jgi:hypothetical protein
MTIIVGHEKPSLSDLSHYGVKGMKWGERMAARREKRKALRSLDKQNRRADNKVRNAEIDAARTRYYTTARKDLKKANAQYKAEKGTIGKYAARKNRTAVRDRVNRDYEMAQQVKSGAETVGAILATVGTVAVYALVSAKGV